MEAKSMIECGAEAGTRTPMSIRSLRPERSASTSSATSALVQEAGGEDYL